MATLPDALDLNDVEAQRPSLDAVRPTDFGLGQAAQAFGQAAVAQHRADALKIRAQAAVDRKAAEPYAQQMQTEIADDYAAHQAAWNGQTGGFAADRIQAARQIAKKYSAVSGLPAGVQSELNNMGEAYVNEVGANAINHEASRLAAPIAQMTANNQAIQIDQAVNAGNASFQPEYLKLKQNWKPGDPPLEVQASQLFDQHFTPHLQGLPDALQPFAQSRLIGEKQTVVADALGYAVNTGNAKMMQAVNEQGDTVLNTITSNPAYFDQAMRVDLPSLVAKLPAGLRDQALREYGQRAVAARVEGLIGHNQATQAYKELQGSTYDGYLDDKSRQALMDRTTSAVRASGPVTADQIVAAHNADQKAQAETEARLNGQTTGFSLTDADGVLSQQDQAKWAIAFQTADRAHAAMGPIPEMTNSQLQAAAVQPDPDASDPDYASKKEVYDIRRRAAAAELQARATDPAANLFDTSKKGPPTKGVGATSAAFQRATALNQSWTQVVSSAGQDQAQAATTLSLSSLGQQAAQGVPLFQRKVIPQAYAGQLAAGLINAPADQKLAAASRLAQTVAAFPATVKLPDGSFAHPQQVLLQQLQAAGLSAVNVSALVDFGADPAKMGRYIQAAQDPKVAAKPTPQEAKEIQQLTAQVTGALKPFFDVAAPLPGSNDLYQARIARTVQIARSEMANGASMGDAVKAATRDLTDGYRYVDGWRMPDAQAGTMSWQGYTGHNATLFGFADGAQMARAGAAKALAALLANNGANIGAIGNEDKRITVGRVSSSARWVSIPDENDSGLMLMIPQPGAPYQPVRDRWGRPVTATWQQLQTYARGTAQPSFDQPPPSAHVAGVAVPAFTRQQAFAALSASIVGDGEHGHTGDLSGKGAAGKWQVMPATVETYAPQLGLPIDYNRARFDDAYNQRIGAAALADNLNHYTTTPGPGGVALAVAAYNAGQGNVNKWLATYGDPRAGKISVDDWVKAIPFKETREYVQRVLPGAVQRLNQGAH